MSSILPVRALLIAHLPSRTLAAFRQRLHEDGFRLDGQEDPGKVAWPSSAPGHSFLMAWYVGPKSRLPRWRRLPGILGFTVDDGQAWPGSNGIHD